MYTKHFLAKCVTVKTNILYYVIKIPLAFKLIITFNKLIIYI